MRKGLLTKPSDSVGNANLEWHLRSSQIVPCNTEAKESWIPEYSSRESTIRLTKRRHMQEVYLSSLFASLLCDGTVKR
jgi:hypothetical protein